MKALKKCKKCSTKTYKNGSSNRFFHPKSIFRRFWGALWAPGGLPGRPGSLPEAFQFVFDSSLCLKTGLDRAPGGSGEVPGHLQGSPRKHFGMISGRFLKSIFRETAMATLPFLFVVDSSFCLKKSLIEPREAPERSPGTPRESRGTILGGFLVDF